MQFLFAWFAALLLLPAILPADMNTPAQECVILLHGLGRTSHSMQDIENTLADAGYCVVNHGYPSRQDDIEWLAYDAIIDSLVYCEAQHTVKTHFVTHSLGGVLVRVYLQDQHIENLGRIVMLSPPNQGSEVADLLRDNVLYQFATGPAGQQLGTGPGDIPRQLRPIPGEIGIIAGDFSSDPWFSPSIPGEDDGKVSVASARLKEMRDFLVLSNGHTFIMQDEAVISQVLYFLRHGLFDHGQRGNAAGAPENSGQGVDTQLDREPVSEQRP
jgi:triacylglycerol lipase